MVAIAVEVSSIFENISLNNNICLLLIVLEVHHNYLEDYAVDGVIF